MPLRTLSDIVRCYIRRHRHSAARDMAFYAEAGSLRRAVHLAARAISPTGKRQSHQRRIPSQALALAEVRLQRAPLAHSRSFAALHAVVEQHLADVGGLGPLTKYDTALRIGAFLGLQPELVYLHAGTRVGARALGLGRSEAHIDPAVLPREFAVLLPREIEDALCIFKEALAALSRKAARRSLRAAHSWPG